MEQRTDAWFSARLGKITGSRVADLMAKTKIGYAASRHNYMAQLICERLTGTPTEFFQNDAMKRGTEKEPEARSIYMLETGEIVAEEGFVLHPEIEHFGASPDGLVGEKGLIEIKCPNTWTHLETIKTGKPKREYFIQMHAQMACTGRDWCDFVSFDDRLPADLAYFCTRIYRDDDFMTEMLCEINRFLDELHEEIILLSRKAA